MDTNCVVVSRLPVLTEAVRLLSDPRLGKGDGELAQRAGWRLLPFLAITSSSPLSLASRVARSSIVARHPLTLNWAEGAADLSSVILQLFEDELADGGVARLLKQSWRR